MADFQLEVFLCTRVPGNDGKDLLIVSCPCVFRSIDLPPDIPSPWLALWLAVLASQQNRNRVSATFIDTRKGNLSPSPSAKKASRKMATLLWVKIAQSMKFDSFRKRGKRTLNPPLSLSSHLGWRVDWLCCVYVLTTPPFPPGGSTLCHLACHLSFAFQPFTRTANQNDSVCVVHGSRHRENGPFPESTSAKQQPCACLPSLFSATLLIKPLKSKLIQHSEVVRRQAFDAKLFAK